MSSGLYSTQKITPQLISQIVNAIYSKAYGSIEIFIENYQVVQITERKITKIKSENKEENKNKDLRRVHLIIQKQ